MEKKIFTLFFIVLTLFFLGCEKKSSPENQNNIILTSYRLIDENRTDEAIQLLETELTINPNNNEYKLVLASAYAHKAGVKIQSLVPIVSKTSQFSKLKIKMIEIDNSQSIDDKINNNVLNISKLLIQFSYFFEVYAAIPNISKEQIVYVRHSINLLNEIDNYIKPEDAFYRAILEIILFKNLLNSNLIGNLMNDDSSNNKRQCKIDFANLNDTIIELGKLLIDILGDLGFSNSKHADEMKKLGEKVANSVSNLTLITTSLIVLDELSDLFLQNTILQQGFGKLIKCDSGE